jgi:hypothetical protein
MYLHQDSFTVYLATVPAFCRAYYPRLLAFPYVDSIAGFADCTRSKSIVDICKRGLLPLVRCVAYFQEQGQHDRSPHASRVDPFYHKWLFNRGLEVAAARGDLVMVQWVVLSYLPGAEVTRAAKAATENDHARVLSWLLRDDWAGFVAFDVEMVNLAAKNGHIQVVGWVRENYKPQLWSPFDVNHNPFDGG